MVLQIDVISAIFVGAVLGEPVAMPVWPTSEFSSRTPVKLNQVSGLLSRDTQRYWGAGERARRYHPGRNGRPSLLHTR